jgi:hypothetical protein
MILPIFGHGKKHERHGKSISVFSVPFSVAESWGSLPSLERHYKMRFSIEQLSILSKALCDIHGDYL